MSMRKQFVQSATRLLERDERVVLLLGDIGVYGFKDAFAAFPDRVYNIGILEQATVSFAAGLAKTGMVPIVHTIAPFLTERCLEQIKIDFGYQELGGSFVTVGASYDYAALGCTHHCPGDVQVMRSIPGMDIVVPGSNKEFDSLLEETYASPRPKYFRLSEADNAESFEAGFGKAAVVQEGHSAVVVAVGPMLRPVMQATQGLDVTVLYYATVAPFDAETLKAQGPRKVLLCEPYYRGGLVSEITDALWPDPVLVRSVGVPRKFLTNYGRMAEHDEALGFTPAAIRKEVELLIDA